MTSATPMEHAVRAALAGGMIGCVALTLVSLIEIFVPTWQGGYLVVFCTVSAIEAYASFGLLRRGSVSLLESARTLVVELGVLFVCLQLCVDLEDGVAPFQDYVPRLDWKTAGLFIPVLLCWVASTETARDLDGLGKPSVGRLGYVPSEQRLAVRFFAGGVVLFLAAGLSQVRVAEAVKLPAPSSSGPVLNVLLYVVLGVLLLGHVQYASLRGRWQSGQITIAPGLGGRWLRYSMLFVAFVGMVALLLPTSNTLGLLDVGRSLWTPFVEALTQIILAVRGPLTWLLKLLGGNASATRLHELPPHLPRHMHLPRRHHNPGHGGGFGSGITLLKSLLFWAVILTAAGYLVRNFGTRSINLPIAGGLLKAVRSTLGRLWTALLSRLRGYAGSISEGLPGGLALPRGGPGPFSRRLGFVRVGSLPAREQVHYYYLNMVRRARRQGISRRRAQTPREYAADLAPRLPGVEGEVRHLTNVFVEARYSRREVTPAESGDARASWQRVRAALRALRRAPAEPARDRGP